MQWRWERAEQPGDPWSNMQKDAALLQELQDDLAALPTVRLYHWDRECVSFGRLQEESSVRSLYPILPLVRRPTGGRAVLHGEDLTIAVATRTEWLPEASGQGVMASYRQIMAGLIDAFRLSGMETSLGKTRRSSEDRNAVQCFDVVSSCDLVDIRTGSKIAGSAQRREGSAILQQMSLPLLFLPDLEGFLCQLQAGFQRALGVEDWLSIDTSDTI